ncbi:PAS domain S-box protein [Sphingomonas lenta]|uniref:histidine kinase n=1 Tax=Sphingomonas lenta TaxID=1141887 RepID=A0A2A2SBB8_9SPHN|nr:PAS domain S-box protein [Sphingomonas lenta]PAX06548.1 histidine kinase [Sphingomonas lenta]
MADPGETPARDAFDRGRRADPPAMGDELLRRMLESSADCIKLLDLGGRLEFMSENGMCAMEIDNFGAVAGGCWSDFWEGEERAKVLAAMDEARAGRFGRFQGHARTFKGASRWWDVTVTPIDDADGRPEKLLAVSRDVTAEHEHAAALRDSAARLALLDELGSATAGLADADAVLAATTRVVGERMGVSICAYADMDPDEDGFTIRGDWAAPGSRSIVGRYRLADFGKLAVQELGAGRPLVINDNSREIAPEEAATFQAIGIAATICMPLVKDGRLTALMAVHHVRPHRWTEAELLTIREVTERSWAHVQRVGIAASLAESEALLNAVIDAMPVGVIVADAAGRILRDNAANRELWGVPPDTAGWEGYGEWEGYWPETGERIQAHEWGMARALLTGERVRDELVESVRFDTGERRFFLNSASPVRDVEGRIVAGVVGAVDVTERRAVEQRLREAEERFRNMADHAPVMVWTTDPSGYCTYLNRAWYQFTGQSEAEAEGFGWLEATHPDDAAEAERVFLEANAARTPFRLEYRLRHKDGGHRWAIDAASPRFGSGGEFLGYVGSVLDIHDRREAEGALRESEARYRALFENIDAGFCIVEMRFEGERAVDYRMTEVNPAFARQTGAGDVAGKWVSEFAPDLERHWFDTYGRVALTGEPARFENEAAPFGRWYDVHAFRTGRPEERRVAILFNDISARRRAEQELRELNRTLERRVQEEVEERTRAEEALRQAQKLEAVGQLTGGIAHDFNNLLTVVVGNIDMGLRALEQAGGEPRVRRALDQAQKGAERAASLTQRLLAFSRRQPLAPKPVDVDKLVPGMSDLLNRSLGETVKLEIVTSPGLWRVEADPNQLESAILNLAINARDAMPQGGSLTIDTANARLDEAYSATHAEVAPGQYVVVTVTDTGEGMPRELLDKVFEPFFTTKEVGKGTGLGLSMVYGFVKQSGGHVKIYSEEGRGTSVKLYLPRLLSGAEEAKEAVLTPGLEVSRRAEVVLVTEDDDDVRAYTVECLRELGYRVLEAHDGPSALRLLDRQGQEVDLLFTDVVMPGMSGRELVDVARERRPGLKVLYTSGYTRDAIMHGGRLEPGVEMIAKPFTFQALAQKVRDVLEAGTTKRVLIAQGDATVRALAAEALGGVGYSVDEAATAAEVLGRVRAAQGRYDAVVLDAGLPDKAGDAVLAELRALHADMPILLAVAAGEEAGLRERLAGDRCAGVIARPFTGGRLAEALRELGVRCARR